MSIIRHFTLGKLALLLLIFFVTTASGAQSLLDQPMVEKYLLREDEVLEYGVTVRGIPAGTQVMQVGGKMRLDGHEVYHIESKSKVSKFFNIFYPFSNESESFICSSNFHPLYYRKKIRDGGYEGLTLVEFDPANQSARITRNQKHAEISIPTGIQDELSAIYLLRTKDMQVGGKYEFHALVGTKSIKATVEVLRIEELKTILGKLKTIVVRTTLKDLTVWLTNDNLRIPVRIEASTKLGNLVSKLEKMR